MRCGDLEGHFCAAPLTPGYLELPTEPFRTLQHAAYPPMAALAAHLEDLRINADAVITDADLQSTRGQ